MKRRIDLTSTVPKREIDHELDWVTVTTSEAYPDVPYSFMGNAKEYSEGRKLKLGMRWKLKLDMLRRKIDVPNKTLIPYVLPLLPTQLSDKSIQKKKKMTSLKRS